MPAGPSLAFRTLVHADWSVRAEGRWRDACRRGAAGWRIEAAAPVANPAGLVAEAQGLGGPALIGVDLPIGAPSAWAARIGATDFLELAAGFGEGAWGDFFDPAAEPADIALRRPFYPARNGARGAHTHANLARGLGVADMDALRRWCDFNAAGKRSGTPLFWTSGPAQVGRAALHFWRTALIPALADGAASVWPFQGGLGALAAPGRPTIAETYPGEAYRWFDLGITGAGKSKTKQSHRAEDAAPLLAAGEAFGATFTPAARAQIEAGFPEGDDAFDAMVGVLAMLAVVVGGRPEGAPDDPGVRRMEGWILGREAAPLSALPR